MNKQQASKRHRTFSRGPLFVCTSYAFPLSAQPSSACGHTIIAATCNYYLSVVIHGPIIISTSYSNRTNMHRRPAERLTQTHTLTVLDRWSDRFDATSVVRKELLTDARFWADKGSIVPAENECFKEKLACWDERVFPHRPQIKSSNNKQQPRLHSTLELTVNPTNTRNVIIEQSLKYNNNTVSSYSIHWKYQKYEYKLSWIHTVVEKGYANILIQQTVASDIDQSAGQFRLFFISAIPFHSFIHSAFRNNR